MLYTKAASFLSHHDLLHSLKTPNIPKQRPHRAQAPTKKVCRSGLASTHRRTCRRCAFSSDTAKDPPKETGEHPVNMACRCCPKSSTCKCTVKEASATAVQDGGGVLCDMMSYPKCSKVRTFQVLTWWNNTSPLFGAHGAEHPHSHGLFSAEHDGLRLRTE